MDVLGVLEPFDNGVLLRGSTDDLDWLARQLAKFSFDFAVREPDDLRVALHHLAENLRRNKRGKMTIWTIAQRQDCITKIKNFPSNLGMHHSYRQLISSIWLVTEHPTLDGDWTHCADDLSSG